MSKNTLEEYVAKINTDLSGDDKISDASQLFKFTNAQRGVTPVRLEAIRKHMKEDAGLLWDWRPEVEALKEENQQLKAKLHNSTSYSRTAIPAFFTFLFIISLFCFWVTAHEVWRPSIELAATKKHYNEKTENEIKNLNRSLNSYQKNIIRCDDFIKDFIKPQYKDDIKNITYMKEMWKTRCLECEAKLEK